MAVILFLFASSDSGIILDWQTEEAMKESNTYRKSSSVAGQIMQNLIENAPTYMKIILPIVQGYLLYRLFWLVYCEEFVSELFLLLSPSG